MGLIGPWMSEALGLTDAQKDQVKSVLQSHRDEERALAERVRAAHKDLQAAIQADAVDEAAIRDKATAVGAVEADGAVLRARIRAEVFQILTPDQQAKVKDVEAKMSERMGRGPGFRKRGQE